MYLKTAQKNAKFLGHFCKKIVQSGHTGDDVVDRRRKKSSKRKPELISKCSTSPRSTTTFRARFSAFRTETKMTTTTHLAVNGVWCYLKKWAISGLFFLYFRLFSSADSEWMNKILPMTGFERRSSGVGSDRSANWATTTTPLLINLSRPSILPLECRLIRCHSKNVSIVCYLFKLNWLQSLHSYIGSQLVYNYSLLINFFKDAHKHDCLRAKLLR